MEIKYCPKELITGLNTLRVKVFTHNDLDGVSCALVLKKLYNSKNISFSFSFISYNQYDEFKKFFDFDNGEARFFDFVIISDLNFTEDNYQKFLREPYEDFRTAANSPMNAEKNNIFKKVFLIDHHSDSEKTLRPKALNIFEYLEYYNDLNHSAAWQVADWCISNMSSEWCKYTKGCECKNYNTIKSWVIDYVRYVNDWDLFEWKEKFNYQARDLNLLFSHMKREKFFMMQEQKNQPVFSFNKSERTLINEIKEDIENNFNRALKSGIIMNHVNHNGIVNKEVQYLVIRTDENISLICDMIKDKVLNKEIFTDCNLGYIVNVSFKYGTINFRRIDETINLAEIANWYGGGGHPFASGCVINSKDENLMKRFIYPILSKY